MGGTGGGGQRGTLVHDPADGRSVVVLTGVECVTTLRADIQALSCRDKIHQRAFMPLAACDVNIHEITTFIFALGALFSVGCDC